MKIYALGLWIILVALGASYGAGIMSLNTPAKVEADKPTLQMEKTRVMNVPMIADGAVRGFIVAQFNFTVDQAKAKTLPIGPEPFLVDEAFRIMYTDDKLDFTHLERYDVNAFTSRLVAAANKKLGAKIVYDVLIQDLTFISKEENDR